jgi:hypothetical protein
VDQTGRNSTQIRLINVELHKYGERILGFSTVYTTSHSLQQLMGVHLDNSVYFPGNMLRKMNFMSGGVNLMFSALTDNLNKVRTSKERPNVMVFGAHVSYAGPGAVKHCPSVTAVAGSSSHSTTYYPGSARLQMRLRRTQKDKKDNTEDYVIENLQIVELEAMMKERFQTWPTKDEHPAVMFYRDGLVHDDPVVQCHYIVTDGETKRVDIIGRRSLRSSPPI